MTGIFTSILEWIVGWVGNYGWSVVVFTLMVRLVLMPLDIKSKKSMRAMSKVQPKVQALQKKYAGDKEKLNLKLNELYRKEHVSPMSGCLPMLISLPILWFMFAAMRNLANEHTISMILQMKDAAAAGDTAEATRRRCARQHAKLAVDQECVPARFLYGNHSAQGGRWT